MRPRLCLLFALFLPAAWLLQAAPARREGTPMPLVGKIEGERDISGVALVGEHLVVVSDESSKFAVFRRKGDTFTLVREVSLEPRGTEIDLEGVAAEGNTVRASNRDCSPRRPSL